MMCFSFHFAHTETKSQLTTFRSFQILPIYLMNDNLVCVQLAQKEITFLSMWSDRQSAHGLTQTPRTKAMP